MATRKVIDAKQNGEKVWLKGHAQATYMSNGSTVEEAINSIQVGSGGIATETDPIFLASPAASITEAKKAEWDNKMDKVTLAKVATSGSYNDLSNKPTIPASVTESTVSGWGFTKNTGTYSKPATGIPVSDLAADIQTSLGKANTALQSYTEQYTGTITGVSANGTSIATSGVANIPAASTSKYGVTKLSSSTSSTSTSLAATASAVKSAYDLANSKQDKLTSGTNIKTVNGQSILGSGDITISSGGDYLPLTGGTITGDLTLTGTGNFIACGVSAGIHGVSSQRFYFDNVNGTYPWLEGTYNSGFCLMDQNGDTAIEFTYKGNGTKFLSDDGTYKTISAGNSNANVQAVDTGDVLDDVNVEYATKAYVNGLIGDINSILESIINGDLSTITFYLYDQVDNIAVTAPSGITWEQFVNMGLTSDNGVINNFRLENSGAYYRVTCYHKDAAQDMSIYDDLSSHINAKSTDLIINGKTYYVY